MLITRPWLVPVSDTLLPDSFGFPEFGRRPSALPKYPGSSPATGGVSKAAAANLRLVKIPDKSAEARFFRETEFVGVAPTRANSRAAKSSDVARKLENITRPS